MKNINKKEKPMDRLIDIIHFTENVSAKIYNLLDKVKIYRAVKREFARSKKHDAVILLLTDDGSGLRIAETSLSPGKLKKREKVSGLRKIALNKSSICRGVVKEGKTVQVKGRDVIAEVFPQSLSHPVSKRVGYEKKNSILTPLKLDGRTIGVFAMSSTGLSGDFIPPVKSLARHISAALELADESAERRKAEKEKERLRTQLVRSEKMATIGVLAGGIAHEFNNMLQIMKAHVEFAKMAKEGKHIKNTLNVILNTSDRTARIIRDLLDFSRKETSGRKLCNITRLIESVLSFTETHLRKDNIEIIKKYKKSLTVKVNKTEIQEVFLNMIINARDAMLPKGGTLEICARQVKENVEVSFKDTGKGIEKENLNKVFEPFYTTKEAIGENDIPGTGLGLYISYGIIQRHGGTIKVQSRVDKGSLFTIELPARKLEHRKRKVKRQKKKGIKIPQ